MICKICNKEFEPSKYRPGQTVCSDPACQRLRQLTNQKSWRQQNPDYFKCLGQEVAWQEKRRRYNRLWKAANKEYVHAYEEDHKEQRREYMREYMRKYR
jgi:hypothetical protein